MNIFDNEWTWLFIGAAVVIVTALICSSKVEIEEQKTRQIEMQCKVDLFKLDITNVSNLNMNIPNLKIK